MWGQGWPEERGEGINQQLALGEYNETQGYFGRMSELCLVWSLEIMMIIAKYLACNIYRYHQKQENKYFH